MKIQRIKTKDIIPIEAPHRRGTIDSLRRFYQEYLDNEEKLNEIPYVFVHNVKGKGIHMVDGHHRVGVAHMFNKDINAIFLNTYRDLYDSYVARDLGCIPYFNFVFDIESKIKDFAWELPSAREKFALSRGVRDFDDFVEKIKDDNFISYRTKIRIGPRRRR